MVPSIIAVVASSSELKTLAGKSNEIYLATDLDREGEAIAWHLAELLNVPRENVYRVVFNSITQNAIQQAFKTAATVPLGVARDTIKILDLAARAIKNGNPNAVTDGAVAVLAARSAALAAAYNVKINLSAIKDRAFVAELTREIQELEHQVIAKENNILAQVNI